jgi:hypothetical protein
MNPPMELHFVFWRSKQRRLLLLRHIQHFRLLLELAILHIQHFRSAEFISRLKNTVG